MNDGLTTDRNDPRLGYGSDDEPVPQNETYLVLSEGERARGFVRPLRTSYVHHRDLGGCGGETTMNIAIAETYAREPTFYGATYCTTCMKHRPVGRLGEFYWSGTRKKVGT